MTKLQLERCLKARAREAKLRRATNEMVKRYSKGRAHHQGCDVGGLFTGMAADCSGSPCWCGSSEVSNG